MSIDLNLPSGKQTIYINRELYGTDRAIHINLSDINIITRAEQAQAAITEFLNGTDITVETADKFIREQIDYIFDDAVSEAVFGRTFATATVGDKLYFEVFLEAVMPHIESAIKQAVENSEARISKYTEGV